MPSLRGRLFCSPHHFIAFVFSICRQMVLLPVRVTIDVFVADADLID